LLAACFFVESKQSIRSGERDRQTVAFFTSDSKEAKAGRFAYMAEGRVASLIGDTSLIGDRSDIREFVRSWAAKFGWDKKFEIFDLSPIHKWDALRAATAGR
jgi:hypothetical protein